MPTSKFPPTASIREMSGTVKVAETRLIETAYGQSVVCITDTGTQFWGNTRIRTYCEKEKTPFNVTFEAPETFTPKGSQKAVEYIPVKITPC